MAVHLVGPASITKIVVVVVVVIKWGIIVVIGLLVI